MDKASLQVQLRDKSAKAKHIRAQDQIPAEFYGKGEENISIQMDYQTFRRLYREAGENTLIELQVEGGPSKKVLVHRVDYDPVTDRFTYVEFINVRMDEKVTTHVAIHLEGQAPAVKEMGGILIQNLDEIEIRCLPADLIHEVTVNVEPIVDFHTSVHVSDIQVPDTIEVLTDLETTVASAQAPREEEPEETTEAPDVASVEVAGEKAEEDAGSEE